MALPISPLCPTPPFLQVSGAYPLILRGREAILRAEALLLDVADRSAQLGDADYVDYFLTQPYTGGKVPLLILLCSRQTEGVYALDPAEVLGAVLVHEYQIAGLPLGVFVTEDFAGERNVIGPARLRSAIAFRVAEHLLFGTGHMVLISLRDGSFGEAGRSRGATDGRGRGFEWCAVQRNLHRRLPLESSYEATLATLGPHTRRNLRYYRRRAEAQLGSRFVAEVDIREKDFVALNRLCAYPTPDAVASWRYHSALSLRGGVFAGIQSAQGEWLSLLGGRRYHGVTAIDWQMNQTHLSAYSLSTVMRSYLIEHEIQQGSTMLLFEGGTPHSMHLSFPADEVADLLAMRPTALAKLLRRYGPAILPRKNFLAETIGRAGSEWRLR